ncbi:MAG: GTA-gp10 family protein [Janthinobacterium lividum]
MAATPTPRRRKAALPAPAPVDVGSTVPPIAARGEISIVLETVRYTLRPSFEAIGIIETSTGKTLYELASAAEGRKLTLGDAAEIIGQCIRAHARSTSDADMAVVRIGRIGELIYSETGGLLVAVKVTIAPLLLLALTGGYTASGERKA